MGVKVDVLIISMLLYADDIQYSQSINRIYRKKVSYVI